MLRITSLLLLLILSLPVTRAEGSSPLAGHPSPYLRAHADDAVAWRADRSKAAAEALEANKPILLSSGYQSCYWCYRMKEDSFSNRAVGELVNSRFVPLLIDRELEPQLDARLQRILEMQRGVGGWPANLVLTPGGYPVAAFGYAAPDDLLPALSQIAERQESAPERLVTEGKALLARLENEREAADRMLTGVNLADLLQRFLQQASAAADMEQGGFGDGEKYPHLPQLQALLALTAVIPDETLAAFMETTLDAMLERGLRDQIGGGFFRYTTDRQWRTPHFEQMLYTQALAVQVLIRAAGQLGEQRYLDAGLATLDNMLRAFRRDDGLFRSSLSAVGRDGSDGGHYLWKAAELETALGPRWRSRIDVLAETPAGLLPRLTPEATEAQRQALLGLRESEPPPADDKALLGLNGLALSALSLASGQQRFRQAGKRLADVLNRIAEDGAPARLIDRSDGGEATLEDLVYAARGLADWSGSTRDDRAALNAAALLRMAHARFHEETSWLAGDLAPLPGNSRTPLIQDSQLPSPAALWIDTAWRLAESSGEQELGRLADTLSLVWPQALYDNTFYHATWLAAMIERRARGMAATRRGTAP
jgi:uncharacterized protein